MPQAAAPVQVEAAAVDLFGVRSGAKGSGLTDLGKLTEAQRAPAQAWIAKANNRQAALAASRQFAADAARSLGSR